MTEQRQKEILSKNLTELIIRSGKEQKAIAFELGEKTSTFNQWVKGKAIPSVTVLQKVAKYFHVRLEDLVDENNYYLNDETAELAQKLYEDENLRMLFDASRDSKPEDIQMVADMLRRFKETNRDG